MIMTTYTHTETSSPSNLQGLPPTKIASHCTTSETMYDPDLVGLGQEKLGIKLDTYVLTVQLSTIERVNGLASSTRCLEGDPSRATVEAAASDLTRLLLEGILDVLHIDVVGDVGHLDALRRTAALRLLNSTALLWRGAGIRNLRTTANLSDNFSAVTRTVTSGIANRSLTCLLNTLPKSAVGPVIVGPSARSTSFTAVVTLAASSRPPAIALAPAIFLVIVTVIVLIPRCCWFTWWLPRGGVAASVISVIAVALVTLVTALAPAL